MWELAALIAAIATILGIALDHIGIIDKSLWDAMDARQEEKKEYERKLAAYERELDLYNDSQKDRLRGWGYTREAPGEPAQPEKKDLPKVARPSWIASTIVGAITFTVLLFANWTYIYNVKPTFTGFGIWWLLVCNLTGVVICFALANLAKKRLSVAPVLSALVALVVLVGTGFYDLWWLGGGNAKKLAGLANVEIIKGEANIYPPTDEQHIPALGPEQARFKAEQAMNQQGLGTLYDLGACNEQDVQGHRYFICELLLTDHKATQQAEYVIPGFIVVDAEDPTENARPVTTNSDDSKIQIHWWPNGWYGGNLERYTWKHNNTYYLDDFKLEVDDNWRPYYTASMNKPPLRFEPAVPKQVMVIDPQTGDVQEYDLDQVPTWVDRIYSATTVKKMMNWWGQWGQAPFKYIRQKSENRYKVNGEPNLVFTDQGIAWQVLMGSWRRESTIQYVVLFDTRGESVRAYPAPQGLVVESRVVEAFNSAPRNIKSYDPINLGLYKIYGELAWVGSLVPNGTAGQTDGQGYPKSQSFIGIGVLPATRPDANNVIIGGTKGDAFDQFSVQIATRTDSGAPNPDAKRDSVTGKVARLSIIPDANIGSFMVLKLEDDNVRTYRGRVIYDEAGSLALTQVGDIVTISFLDTGKPVLAIASITNNTFNTK